MRLALADLLFIAIGVLLNFNIDRILPKDAPLAQRIVAVCFAAVLFAVAVARITKGTW